MKNIHIIVTAVLLMASCKKTEQKSFVGTWESHRIEMYAVDPSGSKEILLVDEDKRASYSFSPGGWYDDGSIKGRYESQDNKITVYSGENSIEMTYVFNNGDLVLTFIHNNTEIVVFLNRKS